MTMDDQGISVNAPATTSPDGSRPSKRQGPNIVPQGVYIPPAKRRALEKNAIQSPEDKQRITWDNQKRIVYGTINRLNADTIKPLIHDLLAKVNCIRLRGILAKSLLLAAVSSSHYCNVYAALVAVLNTKLPEIGELVVKRSVLAFRKHYKRREKQACVATAIFLGHLLNQSVVHELIVLQILTILLDETTLTEDSVEVAIQLLVVTGHTLLEVSPAGVRAVLERLRSLLHEGSLSSRLELKVENLLKLRKTGFVSQIPEKLDLVEAEDQITFDEILLDDENLIADTHLDEFAMDQDYEKNELEWSRIRAEILGTGDEESSSDGDDSSDEDDGEDSLQEDSKTEGESTRAITISEPATSNAIQVIQDLSEADLVHLRRKIYLTIMSSATFEECAHKLAGISIPVGREEELVNMLIECCSQERTFLRYYGMIAGRFCHLENNRWRDAFVDAFTRQYDTIHRLETNKLRNVAKLFAHLLHTDSIPWSILSIIHINEDETTSSSRIFVKILLQEMAEALGIGGLKRRFETDDVERSMWYKGMFPKENIRYTRYAINFFTSIGLGPLTDDMREFLKNAPKLIMAKAASMPKQDKSSSSSESSSSSSTSSSSVSTSSSSSTSSGSSSSRSNRKKKRRSRERQHS